MALKVLKDSYCKFTKKSENAAHRQRERIVVREFLAADVEGIEGIGAVGAVFEEVFLGLGELFA